MNEVKSDIGIPAPAAGGIGHTLKTRRLQRGISLEQASQKTRVHIRFLRSMEEERWQEFPAAVYRQGFLKLYADYLGLDGDQILIDLKNLNLEDKTAAGPGLYKRQPAEAAKQEQLREERPPSYGKVALGVGILAVAALSYIFVAQRDRPAPATQSLAVPLAQTPAPATESTAPASSLHTFKMNVKRNVWVRVWVDDRMRMEGIVQSGVMKDWTGKDNFRLEFGNGNSLEVLMDDQPLSVTRTSPTGSGEYAWPVKPAARPRAATSSVTPAPAGTPAAPPREYTPPAGDADNP